MNTNTLIEKGFTLGLILLFVGTISIPDIHGSFSHHMNNVLQLNTHTPTDITITDWTGDVCSFHYFTTKWTLVTNSSEIEVSNLDLTQATYQQQGILATLCLQVAGSIENRGHILYGNISDEINATEYAFQLTTSEQDYLISYVNQTGILIYNDTQINLTSSAFTVIGNTLSITFPLVSLNETYENLSVTSTFIRTNFSSHPPMIVYLSDTIPNLWSKVLLFGTFNTNNTKGEYMTIEAHHLWMIRFHPFQLIHYKPGEIIRVSTPYKAKIITAHFLVGLFNVLEL